MEMKKSSSYTQCVRLTCLSSFDRFSKSVVTDVRIVFDLTFVYIPDNGSCVFSHFPFVWLQFNLIGPGSECNPKVFVLKNQQLLFFCHCMFT